MTEPSNSQADSPTLLLWKTLSGETGVAERLAALLGKLDGQFEEIKRLLNEMARWSCEQRGVQIRGDVTHSIIITGDGNTLQLQDGGRFARWWEEIGPDPESVRTVYLKRVAEVYAPLYFPLAHLSQPIPLDQVYIDLPIVKPATEEALLQPSRPGQRVRGDAIHRVDTLLQSSNHAAIVGFMGAGKTTTLHHLTWVYAARPSRRPYWRSDRLIPFYSTVRDLAELWGKPERDRPERLVECLSKAVSFSLAGTFSARNVGRVLQPALEAGDALVLLDALDEFRATDLERSEFMRSLQAAWNTASLKQNRIVLTSRPYRFLNPFGFDQYKIEDLHHPHRFISRLGRVILQRSHAHLSEDAIDVWLSELEKQIASPRLSELASPLYLTLMVYLGTSEGTVDASVAFLSKIERQADPYRYFLLKTIEWEQLKGSPLGMEAERALLVLSYAGYYTFVEPPALALSEQITSTIGGPHKEVADGLEFWRRTGLLWQDTRRAKTNFRHSGFQAFAVALALRDMVARSQARKVEALWDEHEWDVEWQTVRKLFASLTGGGDDDEHRKA